MTDPESTSSTWLERFSARGRWLVLFACTAFSVLVLHFLDFPASFLVGAMVSGVVVSAGGGAVHVPTNILLFSQAFIGCMIGRAISWEMVRGIVRDWPLFLLMVGSVSALSFILGWLLVKSKALPGTTGIWGMSPGAALIMTLMSEGYGADSRLVAMMQYSRVMIASLLATMVAGIWGVPISAETLVPGAATASAAFDWTGFAHTVLLALLGFGLGMKLKISAGAILIPLFLGSFLNITGAIHIVLPSWLLSTCYCLLGWGIGLRFTRHIIAYALSVLPRMILAILCLIAACGGLAALVVHYVQIDPIVAYLATNPSGVDGVAAICASIAMDAEGVSFVMTVQVCRFLLVSLTSPPIAIYIVRKAGMAVKQE